MKKNAWLVAAGFHSSFHFICFCLAFTICNFSLVRPCSSQTVLNAVDSGWYWSDDDGLLHTPSNTNFIAGYSSGAFGVGRREYRNFFVFDLTNIQTRIESVIFNVDLTSFGASAPNAELRTWNIYDVETDLTILANAFDLQTTFDDLGTGEVFGSIVYDRNVSGTTVSAELNVSAIAEMNSASGRWAIGGAFVEADTGDDAILFNGSNLQNSSPRLNIVTIPEPNSTVLILLCGVSASVMRRPCSF